MPTYDFQCSECNFKVVDLIFKISEYDEKTLKDKPCTRRINDQFAGSKTCTGIMEHTFEKPSSFSFKGGAPTPTFFPKRKGK